MTLDLSKLLVNVRRIREGKEPPIPCKGYEINTPDQHEYDCLYPYADKVNCDECIVNGGAMDPRTGKKARKRK